MRMTDLRNDLQLPSSERFGFLRQLLPVYHLAGQDNWLEPGDLQVGELDRPHRREAARADLPFQFVPALPQRMHLRRGQLVGSAGSSADPDGRHDGHSPAWVLA